MSTLVDNNDIDAQKQEVPNNIQEPTSPEMDKEINWKKFKEARAQEREQLKIAQQRAKEEADKAEALKAALESLVNKNPSPQYTDSNLSDDDRIAKTVDALLEKKLKNFERERYEREAREYPERLRKTYPDFDQVVDSHNLDYLDFHFPEISKPLSRMPDGQEKWEYIYQAAKKHVPNHNAMKDAKLIEKNLNKPQAAPNAAGQQNKGVPPIMLSQAQKDANWARMQKELKEID